MKYLDLFKKEISVGDYIIYSAVDGRSGVLRVGKVLELTKGNISYESKKVPKIKVKSANYGFLDWKGNTRIDGWTRQKDVTLSFFERVAVVSRDSLSEEAIKILED